MKWETAKTWLIVAFLLLDCFLGWQVAFRRQAQAAYTEPYADLLANTKTLLAEHGLILEAAVPQAHPQMSILSAAYATPSLQQLASVCFPHATSVQVDASAGSARTTAGVIQVVDKGTWTVSYQAPVLRVKKPSDVLTRVWNGDLYQLDPVADKVLATSKDAGHGTETWVEVYQSYPVFDAVVTATVSGGALANYEQVAITNIHTVGSAKPTISALDALDSLANSVDQATANTGNPIIGIELGYAHKSSSPSGTAAPGIGSNYWFPVWRITTMQAVYDVNAYTGEVNTPPAP
ncbi:MAG: two-component system regulatory protein YycI [Alicyclobacillus sp.]|nr:two-component system regulatory protein YycI [Alicyclobacillus sp.]